MLTTTVSIASCEGSFSETGPFIPSSLNDYKQ